MELEPGKTVCKADSEKDVFRTLSSSHQTSQIDFYLKVSQRSVHVGCIISRCLVAIAGSLHHLYNTRRRGQAEVAYLDRKAMRRPDDWDRQRKFLPRLFVSA